MDFISAIFDFIGKIFESILSVIKKLLPYILIAAAAFFTFGGSMVLWGMTLSGGSAAALALGASFLLAPDETVALVDRTAHAIGDASVAVIDAAVPVVSAIGTGLFSVLTSNPLFWGAVAFFGYKYLTKDDDKQQIVVAGNQPALEGGNLNGN